MSNEWPIELKISLESLEDALQGFGDADDLAYVADDDDGEALRSVTQGIASNHVEVVARFARNVFGGQDSAAEHEQFAAALSSLVRLTEATNDTALHTLLSDMLGVVQERLGQGGRMKDRARFLPKLTRFVEAFAAQLPEAEGARLHEIVQWEPERAPLLIELGALRGIGPRRLHRLYCCGLYTVATVAHADPSEVAAVSGLPLTLSNQVVGAAREFAIRERKRSLEEALASIRDYAELSRALGISVPEDAVERALAAVAGLQVPGGDDELD